MVVSFGLVNWQAWIDILLRIKLARFSPVAINLGGMQKGMEPKNDDLRFMDTIWWMDALRDEGSYEGCQVVHIVEQSRKPGSKDYDCFRVVKLPEQYASFYRDYRTWIVRDS